MGRFLSTDPVGFSPARPDMVNRYAYAANDPVNNIDPTGMCSESSSRSEKFCYIEDTIKSFLEPIVERAMNFAGVDVVPEGQRDPDGLYSHEATANSASEEAIAISGAVVAAGIGRLIPGGKKGRGNPNGSGNSTSPDGATIHVDSAGNALPGPPGATLAGSPDGNYLQVIDPTGRPTGVRLDRGGHRNQHDPRAQGPHGHQPGVTNPDGDPHLPIRY